MKPYKNKQLVARNTDGKVVAYIGIIDTDALRIEKTEMFKSGYEVKESYNQRFLTQKEEEEYRIAKILKGGN